MSKRLSNTKHKKHYAQHGGGGCGAYHVAIPAAVAAPAPAAAVPVLPAAIPAATPHVVKTVEDSIRTINDIFNTVIQVSIIEIFKEQTELADNSIREKIIIITYKNKNKSIFTNISTQAKKMAETFITDSYSKIEKNVKYDLQHLKQRFKLLIGGYKLTFNTDIMTAYNTTKKKN